MEKGRPGFTLIELLVVIAVISILAAVLFPVFAEVRENARGATCLSNARQVGIAMLLYIQDYDGVILPGLVPTGQPPQPASFDPFLRHADVLVWSQLVQPYLRNGQVVYCPSFNESVFIENGAAPTCDDQKFRNWFPARFYYSHYGIVGTALGGGCTAQWPRVAFPGNHWDTVPMKTLAQVVRPAETALLQDNATLEARDGSVRWWFGCEGGFQGAGRSRHRLGSTYLFLDGHARMLSLNPERKPAIPCPGAQIGNKSYPDCVCARYLTWDY